MHSVPVINNFCSLRTLLGKLGISVAYDSAMESTAKLYRTVAERVVDMAAVNGKLRRVQTGEYRFTELVINLPDLEWLTKHKNNYAEFLKATMMKRTDEDIFDPFLESCPIDKLLLQRLNEELVRVNALRLAKTRLIKSKHVGINESTPIVAYDGVHITPADRHTNGK